MNTLKPNDTDLQSVILPEDRVGGLRLQYLLMRFDQKCIRYVADVTAMVNPQSIVSVPTRHYLAAKATLNEFTVWEDNAWRIWNMWNDHPFFADYIEKHSVKGLYDEQSISQQEVLTSLDKAVMLLAKPYIEKILTNPSTNQRLFTAIRQSATDTILNRVKIDVSVSAKPFAGP